MKSSIRGVNIEITPAIREYIEKKLSKLDRYFDNTDLLEAKVNVKVNSGTQKVEVTIPMKQMVLRAEERNTDVYAAMDLVIDKLERQVRKHKTKVNRKMREASYSREFVVIPQDAIQAPEFEEDELEIVRTKTVDLKPMDVEEAILQMNMLGHNFYVFKNAETDLSSVVYVRNDGRYGFINTHFWIFKTDEAH